MEEKKTAKDEFKSISPEDRKQLELVLAKVIDGLRKKSAGNQKTAQIYFFVLVAVIIVGLAVFVFAYRITSEGNVEKAADAVQPFLKTQLSALKHEYDSLFKTDTLYYSATLNYLDSLVSNPQDVSRPSKVLMNLEAEYLSERNRPTANLRGFPSPRILFDTLISRYVSKVKSNILVELRTSNYALFNLINTSVVRFGSVVIVLFLVQIFVRVFRYNTRLANFYSARADALEIFSAVPNFDLEKLIGVLSPDLLDLGVSKSPTEQLVELTKLVSKPG